MPRELRPVPSPNPIPVPTVIPNVVRHDCSLNPYRSNPIGTDESAAAAHPGRYWKGPTMRYRTVAPMPLKKARTRFHWNSDQCSPSNGGPLPMSSRLEGTIEHQSLCICAFGDLLSAIGALSYPLSVILIADIVARYLVE